MATTAVIGAGTTAVSAVLTSLPSDDLASVACAAADADDFDLGLGAMPSLAPLVFVSGFADSGLEEAESAGGAASAALVAASDLLAVSCG